MSRAKICGVCRAEDAAVVADAGAAYMGVILAPGKRRSVGVADAAGIFAAAPGVLRVGVFVDPREEEVVEAARVLRLDVVQLHGAESAALLESLRRRGAPLLWKAVPVRTRLGVREAIAAYSGVADAILLDGGSGGRGQAFDWDSLAGVRTELPRRVQLVMAGGLTPGNVRLAQAALAPDVLDVSSGVETEVGVKSAAQVHAFVAAVRGA